MAGAAAGFIRARTLRRHGKIYTWVEIKPGTAHTSDVNQQLALGQLGSSTHVRVQHLCRRCSRSGCHA